MKFEHTQIFNFEGAFRGLRNPKDSWHLSDSYTNENGDFIIGPKDLKLAQSLIRGGSEHRKFMRQIMVCVDITAPLYWLKELDTYKVGTTANSCSTMHKITSKPITRECFSWDPEARLHTPEEEDMLDTIINICENLRLEYLKTGDKDTWRSLIQLLPNGWNQKRTITLNYENLLSIHHQRRNHKLIEWHIFCDWVEELPYMKEFLTAAGQEVRSYAYEN